MAGVILIVEDHDVVRRSLREWLAVALPQYRIIEASTGEEALALAERERPCLVLMDIGLPHMNGIEATQCIKSAVPGTRVVILSINEEPAFQTEAARAGATAYVPKRKLQTQLMPELLKLLQAPVRCGRQN